MPHSASVMVTGLGIRMTTAGSANSAGPVDSAGSGGTWDHEDEIGHSLAAATAAVRDLGPSSVGSRTGTVWASSTAGLEEYARTCADIPALGPGRVSPRRAVRSAYTGPVTAVSVRFGFDGPYLNLTGAQDAGAHAVVEAARMIQQGQCERVLAGGSAAWPAVRPGSARPRTEGAACVLLERRPGPGGGGAAVRLLDRARVETGAAGRKDGPAPFIGRCLERMGGRPRRVVLSASAGSRIPAGVVAELCGAPCLDVEARWGDLGAAGGFAALAAAAAMTTRRGEERRGQGRPHILVLAVGAGNAVAIEVTSRTGGR
ncbi:beta-ketoacyl synthase N-terminal-like domain-containing protein [Streptomyces sp. NPDC057445]|uniref:beta-ketoacyl synthase N-terminal-like domain-containing protein n=1 Tax=Streptomyces sp. NPDC057445 TaxID=3346136 RepID=UPI003674F573